MKKILITGTLGFIGSNFVRYMLKHYPEYKVIGIDKAMKEYNLENSFKHENYHFYFADIADEHILNNIFLTEKPDIIINFAAQSFVDDSIKNITPFIHSNILGLQVLVDMALKYNIEKFIHISTDEVLGQKLSLNDIPWTENDPMLPRNPYACTKASSELIINSAFHTHGLKYIITRSCNVFGPRQKKENLIPHILHSLINKSPIHLHGTGLNFRQYIYVEDKINAIINILQHGKIYEIYNIGDENYYSNLDLVNVIANKMNIEPNITFISDRKAHDFGYKVSNEKLKKLGWSPQFKFDDALENTIQWYKKKLLK